MAEDRGEQGQVVTVAGQEGGDVLVAVPMVGFPEGFTLRPGERVVLVRTPSGPAVRPFVRAVRGRVSADELSGGELSLKGRRQVTQESTVVADQPREGARAEDEDVVWVVERGDAEGPEQVIAVRRADVARD